MTSVTAFSSRCGLGCTWFPGSPSSGHPTNEVSPCMGEVALVCSHSSLLILTPALLRGQSDQPRLDFSLPALHAAEPAPPEPGSPSRPVLPPGAIGFQQIARAAGTIFSGTVTAIARHPRHAGPGGRNRRHHVSRGPRHPRRDSRHGPDRLPVDGPVVERPALPGRRARAPLSLSSQQTRTHQFCRR